ncbi:MAG: hypothetical protein ABSA11_15615 [Candidatus Bathyarchaeia archaeon]
MNRIERFLLPYSSEKTVRVYKVHLKKFFSTFGKVNNLEESAEEYFTQKRDYEENVVRAGSSLK